MCCQCYSLINEVSPIQAFALILHCVSQRLKHIEASAVLFFFIQDIIPREHQGINRFCVQVFVSIVHTYQATAIHLQSLEECKEEAISVPYIAHVPNTT